MIDIHIEKDNRHTENLNSTGRHRLEGTPPERDEVISLLHRCGHFAAHHIGGTRGSGVILRLLSDSGEMTQQGLLEALDIKPGSLSETLTRLEDRGLITRRRDDQDRRRTIIAITPAGRETLEKNSSRERPDPLAALTEEERQELSRLLKKLDDSWHTGEHRHHHHHSTEKTEKSNERTGD